MPHYPDLKKHVAWAESARSYLMERNTNIKRHEAHLELDYGGFTDSEGSKVSVWSATVMTAGQKQQHLDFFFNARRAKKNGTTGIFFLGEVLDKDRSGEIGCSLMKSLFPDVSHLILSGDTGNGFRAYQMLDELSKLFKKYAYSVELVPLAPAHAYNRTDARLAHMNTFLNALKAYTRVFGAEMIARAFRMVSDPRHAKRRAFMRVHGKVPCVLR